MHKELDESVQECLRRGYAIDQGEGIEGIHCIAAPILDEYGQPLAAITAMAPVARMPESAFDSFAELCTEAARDIQQRMRE